MPGVFGAAGRGAAGGTFGSDRRVTAIESMDTPRGLGGIASAAMLELFAAEAKSQRARNVARAQRTERQIRAVVRDELARLSPSPSLVVDAASAGDGPRAGAEDPAPAAGHPDLLARRIDLIAAALPAKFTLAYCPSMVDRRVVVDNVLEAMAAIDEAGLS